MQRTTLALWIGVLSPWAIFLLESDRMKGVEAGHIAWAAFFVASAINAYYALVLSKRDIWPLMPWVRRAHERQRRDDERRKRVEELQELAKELEEALADLVGVIDANVTKGYEEDRIKPGYAKMLQMLTQLNIRFNIPVPMEPFDMVLPDNAARLHQVVAHSLKGDQKAARKSAKGDWSTGPWESSR